MNEFNKFIDLLLPWWWGEPDKITDGFISVILLTFLVLLIILTRRTFRRASRIDGLSKDVRQYNRPAQPSFKHNLKVSFERNNLGEAWQEFEDSLIEHPREAPRVVYKTDDASLYFGEDRLLDQELNLRFWNSVPALLVGLGILGTFVGLVWGLRPFAEIDFTEIEKIGDAIRTLLSGVSTAFVTSVWGMTVSLAFNLFEKRRVGRISQAITNLQRALDKLFTLTTQEAISFRQEDELAQQTAALKSFSTDLANEIKGAMAKGRKEIISELKKAPEDFSSAMAKQLEPSLDSLNTAVEGLRLQKEESSTDAIQRLVEEFRESLSGSATAQLERLAETVRSASEGLTTLPEQLTSMMTSVQEQINQSRQLLSATSEEQTGQLQNLMDGMLNTFQRAVDSQQSSLSEATDQSIQALQSTIAQLQESITSITSQNATESEAMIIRMRELLESAANQTDEQLNRRMADMETISSQSIQALQHAIAQLQESIASTASQNATESEAMIIRMRELLESAANRTDEQLNQRMENVEAVSNQSIQALQSTIGQLQESITSTASQIAAESAAVTDNMRHSFEQTAGQLDESVQNAEERVGTLLEKQSEQIQAVNAQLENSQRILEGSRGMMQQIDESVTSMRQVIGNIRAFSDQMITGAAQLETAGQRLTQASSAFNQQNENYLAANRETIEQLQGTLIQSRDLLNDFVQRFQTIDTGLQDIFKEVQRGLSEYAKTSHDSINKYLVEFSSLVTNAVDSLDGSIEGQRDLVEDLSDSIEKLGRR